MASVALVKYEGVSRKLASSQDRARRKGAEVKELKVAGRKDVRLAVQQSNRMWSGTVIVSMLMMLLGGAIGGQLHRISTAAGKPERSTMVGTASFIFGAIMVLFGTAGKRVRPAAIVFGFLLMGVGGTQFTLKAMSEDWIPGSWEFDPTGSQKDD